MEVTPLRSLIAVARLKSVSEAARSLHLTQPAVSAHLRRLESEFGAKLVVRSGRGSALTPAGEFLVPYAERVIHGLEDLGAAAEDFRGARGGSLAIGTTDVASVYVLPRVYRRFVHAHPAIDLSVVVEGTESLLDALSEDRIELLVASLGEEERGGLVFEAIATEKLVAILPTEHPLASRRRVRLDELAPSPLITFKSDSHTRRRISRRFAENGLSPTIGMEISSPEAIRKLVEVGLGYAFLSERSVRAAIREGRVVSPAIEGVRFERSIGIAYQRGRYLSPAADAFLALVRDRGKSKRKPEGTA